MKCKENFKIYGIISIIILIFNIPSCIPDILMLDDYGHYPEVLKNHLNKVRFGRSLVNPIFWFLLMKIFTFSSFLSRFLVVIIFIIPTALISFKYIKQQFNLPDEVIAAAVIIPTIIPGITMIPIFIIGCYTTWGLLFFFISTQYLNDYFKENRLKPLILFTFFYFISIVSITNILIAIPFFLLILLNNRISIKNKMTSGVLIFIISLIEFILVKLSPYPSVSINSFDTDIIIARINQAIAWLLPYPFSPANSITIWTIALITLTGVVLKLQNNTNNFIHKENNYRKESKFSKFYLFLFSIIWVIVSIVPFLLSLSFTNRYMHVASIGAGLLLILMVYSITTIITKKSGPLKFILALTVLLVGFTRVNNVNREYSLSEKSTGDIRDFLKTTEYPIQSQIVIFGDTYHLTTGGFWLWSEGALQHITKRSDITGLIGRKLPNFSNPFNMNGRNYNNKMTGLDESKPLFIYRKQQSNFTRIPYILKWNGDLSKGTGVLFKSDQTSGTITPILNCNGKYDLDQYIHTNNIVPTTIAGYEQFPIEDTESLSTTPKYLIEGFKRDKIILSINTDTLLKTNTFLDYSNLTSLVESIIYNRDGSFITRPSSFNLIINSKFDKDLSGWTCWSKNKTCQISWDSTNNGQLIIESKEPNNKEFSLVIGYLNNDSLTINENYLLEVKIKSSKKNSIIKAHIRDAKNYKSLADSKTLNLTSGFAKEHILFKIDQSSSSARIDLQFDNTNGQIIIDDVTLFRIEEDKIHQTKSNIELIDNLLDNYSKIKSSNLDSLVINRLITDEKIISVVKEKTIVLNN